MRYTAKIAGTERDFTCYRTKKEARASVHTSLSPCLIELHGHNERGEVEVWFDAYPLGHPLPKSKVTVFTDAGEIKSCATVIERATLTATGMKWKATA